MKFPDDFPSEENLKQKQEEIEFGELRAFVEYLRSMFPRGVHAEPKDEGELLSLVLLPEEEGKADLEHLAGSLKEDRHGRFANIEVSGRVIEAELTEEPAGFKRIRMEIGNP